MYGCMRSGKLAIVRRSTFRPIKSASSFYMWRKRKRPGVPLGRNSTRRSTSDLSVKSSRRTEPKRLSFWMGLRRQKARIRSRGRLMLHWVVLMAMDYIGWGPCPHSGGGTRPRRRALPALRRHRLRGWATDRCSCPRGTEFRRVCGTRGRTPSTGRACRCPPLPPSPGR